MKIIKGSTRWVLVINKFVFKIPSFYSWRNFLNGLLCNMQEIQFSKCIDMNNKLCPVLFYLPGGFLVIMPKVRVLQQNELPKYLLEQFCTENQMHLPVEIKYDSFGFLNSKLVAIDYGT